MGKLHACFVVALTALAACGDDGGAKPIDAAVDVAVDSKVFLDAPPPMFDFTCMGNAAPTMAAANITLSGTVQEVDTTGGVMINPVNAAPVKACDAQAANCTGPNSDGNDTTDAQGAFSIGPFATSMAPQDDFLEATVGSRTTYVYPASPFIADQANIPVLSFSAGALAALQIGFGCDTSKALIGLAVTDCAQMPITETTNLTITVKQGGNAVSGTTVVDLGTLQAQAAGTFLICGVPANASTEIGASYNGMQLRAHNVKTVTGATTATLLRPGY